MKVSHLIAFQDGTLRKPVKSRSFERQFQMDGKDDQKHFLADLNDVCVVLNRTWLTESPSHDVAVLEEHLAVKLETMNSQGQIDSEGSLQWVVRSEHTWLEDGDDSHVWDQEEFAKKINEAKLGAIHLYHLIQCQLNHYTTPNTPSA